MPPLLTRAARVTLDLLFPPRCALCGAGGTFLCAWCEAALPQAAGVRCEVCFEAIARGTRCRHCIGAPPAFTTLRAPCAMARGARTLTHALKYDGQTALAPSMAALILPLADGLAVDAVVPVPLHRGRQRSRGYNQSEELARPIAESLGVPLAPAFLKRPRPTQPLVKAMSREERRAIVAGAFTAERRAAGLRVLLVDDVATTGATLDACAKALREAGAGEVHCLTWARA